MRLARLPFAIALIIMLAGCGENPEQLAAEQRVRDLRQQLSDATERADEQAAIAATVQNINAAASAENQTLRLAMAANQETAGALQAKLDTLHERIRQRATDAGVDAPSGTSAVELFAALSLEDGLRDGREIEQRQYVEEAATALAALDTRVADLEERAARLAEEADASRDGWEAQSARSAKLSRALEQAHAAYLRATEALGLADEDNVALVQANVLLRRDIQSAAAGQVTAQQSEAQMRSSMDTLNSAHDSLESQNELLTTEHAAALAIVDQLHRGVTRLKSDFEAQTAELLYSRNEHHAVTREADKLAGQLTDVLAERDAANTELEATNKAVAALSERATAATATHHALAAQLEASGASNSVLRTNIATRMATASELRSTASALRARVDLAKDRATADAQALAAMAVRTAELTTLLKTTRDEAAAQHGDLSARAQKLTTRTSELESSLKTTLGEAAKQNTELTVRAQKLAATNGELKSTRARLAAAVTEAVGQRERAAEAIDILTDTEAKRVALLESLRTQRQALADMRAARDFLVEKLKAAGG
jgi:hypothetical protein